MCMAKNFLLVQKRPKMPLAWRPWTANIYTRTLQSALRACIDSQTEWSLFVHKLYTSFVAWILTRRNIDGFRKRIPSFNLIYHFVFVFQRLIHNCVWLKLHLIWIELFVLLNNIRAYNTITVCLYYIYMPQFWLEAFVDNRRLRHVDENFRLPPLTIW